MSLHHQPATRALVSVITIGLAASLALLTSCAALAQQPPPNNRTLAASCSGCHGPQGQGAQAMPAIAGLPREHLAAALRAFRAGQRPATVMHQLAKGYSDDEIARLAEHFAALKRAN
jgi:cytochrome c553